MNTSCHLTLSALMALGEGSSDKEPVVDIFVSSLLVAWTSDWTSQWRHNERDGVSNRQRLDCSLNRLFRRRWKKHQRGIYRWPVYSPYKGPVTRKKFPFHGVIMPDDAASVHVARWSNSPDSKVHGADMGPTWVLSAPDGPQVGPMNLTIRDALL